MTIWYSGVTDLFRYKWFICSTQAFFFLRFFFAPTVIFFTIIHRCILKFFLQHINFHPVYKILSCLVKIIYFQFLPGLVINLNSPSRKWNGRWLIMLIVLNLKNIHMVVFLYFYFTTQSTRKKYNRQNLTSTNAHFFF